MKRYFCRFVLLIALMALFFFQRKCDLWGNPLPQNVKNFRKEDYRGAKQNWSVNTGPNGFVYFANHKGLLEFDGTTWQLYKLPNETILRSVLAVSDSLIYTSGYRELGYWIKEKTGILTYRSLNETAEKYFSGNEEFWNIAVLDDVVYFHSFTRILAYRNDSVFPIDVPGFTNTMHQVGNKILIAVSNQGIFSIENEKPAPFITNPFFRNKTVRFLLPYKNDQLMIGTASDGIFIWNGMQFQEWNPGWTDYFKRNEVNRAYINIQGQLIIGTITDGILIFDAEGKLSAGYNTEKGLQNNTVLGISTDQFNNIWLALDGGIDFISNSSDDGFKIETIPSIGAVYDAAIFEDHVYLATNQGLFVKSSSEDGPYEMVPGTQGQNWDCHVIDEHLFVGHNEGTLVIKNGKTHFVTRRSGGFSIIEDPERDHFLIVSTYSGMIAIKKEGDMYVEDHIIRGFGDLIRYIEIDPRGNIWASHMHRGIYKLQLNNLRDSVISVKYFGTNSVFKKDHAIHVFKIENRIVFTTENKLFTYDDLNDSIIPYSFLNNKLNEFAQAHRIIAAPDHHYWFISKEKIGLFSIFNNEVRLVKSYPRSLFPANELIDEFENIMPLTATQAIICLENGIAQLDAATGDSISKIREFKPQLRSLKLTGKNAQINKIPDQDGLVRVKYKYHNISFRYSFPHFTHQPIYFQSFLKGLDQKWTEKTLDPNFSFDRLPVGNYELFVKTVDQWGNESRVQQLSIEIEPPWYSSNYSRAGYSLLFIILLLGFRSWGIKQTRKKERLQHEKKEKELIQLRNEKLRTEVKHKSKELANSTMAIIKKNEFLLDIKKIITKQKEELGSRYPDKYYSHITRKIEENISSRDDWQLFETNFERAHEQFLNKIKEMYPELTPKDLRLCAYLRMNLSSKEIAPLLGISVRGVENHRYRLRKKMNLDHDEKLIDLILGL